MKHMPIVFNSSDGDRSYTVQNFKNSKVAVFAFDLFYLKVMASGEKVSHKNAHRLFQNFSAKEFLSAYEGKIFHRDNISFHLSHQPLLKVTSHFYVEKITHLLHNK